MTPRGSPGSPDWSPEREEELRQAWLEAPPKLTGRVQLAGYGVNLHVHPPDSPEIARNLRFRDRLRSDQADRELYERTKRQLASRDWTYMQQYADAKGEVVETIMQRAEAAGAGAADPA